MNITILVPPCYDHKQPAERSAGCTRIVYPMINIYELTLAATLRETGRHAIRYRDFVFNGLSIADFTSFLQTDDSDAYSIWTVNLSIDSDLQAINDIRKSHPNTPIVLFGPGATFYTAKCLVDKTYTWSEVNLKPPRWNFSRHCPNPKLSIPSKAYHIL